MNSEKENFRTMGTESSTSQLADLPVALLEHQGIGIKEKTAKEFIKTLEKISPWLVHSGGLNIPDWEQVMRDLQGTLQRYGPKSIPATTLSLWRLVKDALLSTNAKIRGRMSKIERTFGAAQDDASRRSLQTSDSDQDSSSEEEEGETSEEEIEVPKRRINKHRATERSESHPPSVNPFFKGEGATAPPAYEPYSSLEWCCEDKAIRREVIFSEPPLGQGAAYPVVEVPDPSNAGQSIRHHVPLSFKELKNLKEAVSAMVPSLPLLLPFLSPMLHPL